jgi:hypothetical protein
LGDNITILSIVKREHLLFLTDTTREVVFVASGVQIGFPKQQPIVDCAKQIDEFHIPHMPEFKHIVTYDIVPDMMDYSTLVRKYEPENASSNHPT